MQAKGYRRCTSSSRLQDVLQPLGVERPPLAVDEAVDAEPLGGRGRPVPDLVVPVAMRMVLEPQEPQEQQGGQQGSTTRTQAEKKHCNTSDGRMVQHTAGKHRDSRVDDTHNNNNNNNNNNKS